MYEYMHVCVRLEFEGVRVLPRTNPTGTTVLCPSYICMVHVFGGLECIYTYTAASQCKGSQISQGQNCGVLLKELGNRKFRGVLTIELSL